MVHLSLKIGISTWRRSTLYSLTDRWRDCWKWGPFQPAARPLSEAISRRGSMTMKAWKLTAGSLALTAMLAGALPVQAQAPAPIKIGASMSLTGTYAKPGSYQKEGYDICAEEVNAKGGLLGRKIEFVVYDDQSMPATA